MKVIYICGPIRNDNPEIQKRNIGKGILAAKAIWQAGGAAICPHMNAYFDAPANDNPAGEQTKAIEADLELIRRSDAILALPGWASSVGTSAEVCYARGNGITIFDDLAEAVRWVES